MEQSLTIQDENRKIFSLLSNFLHHSPNYIKKEDIDEFVQLGVSTEYAYSTILSALFGLDIAAHPQDKAFFNHYFPTMIRELDPYEYMKNPYYKNIKIPETRKGMIEYKHEKFHPFEAFVWNDIVKTKEGRQIPQIGFFQTEFHFPVVLENGRVWMTIAPNEIETMKEPIEKASGHVLTYGLGLGYFAYMVSEKDIVDSVTIVDIHPDIVHLFEKHILPQFKQKEKIKIVQADAFQFAEREMPNRNFDFVFTDLWHDVSDGKPLYLKMKQYEQTCPNTTFMYWIEKSILCDL